jgi:hypothetical protein
VSIDELRFRNPVTFEELRGYGLQGQIGLGAGVSDALGLQSFVEAGQRAVFLPIDPIGVGVDPILT